MGNALGAWMGGVTITAGLGCTSPIWAGAGITLLGLGSWCSLRPLRSGTAADATAAAPEPASPVRTASRALWNSSTPSGWHSG